MPACPSAAPDPSRDVATPQPPGTDARATVARLLAQARAQGLDRLDATLLLGHVLGVGRAWLLAHDDAPVEASAAGRFAGACAQRQAGVPLAYLVGEREFHGLSLRLTPDVLVPRPDTETLVDWAIEWLQGPLAALPHPAVADLGTGSGAIALAVGRACPRARVSAVDCSAAALAVARANGERLGIDVQWLQGDWFAPLAGRRFDLVLSNPPYIDADDPHLAALHAEPRLALTPGPDGLAALRQLADAAPAHLGPGGVLMLEHGHGQGPAVRALLARTGLEVLGTRRDLAGHERCTAGRLPGPTRDAGGPLAYPDGTVNHAMGEE
jgi:release factor glutamine methyltransferase